MFKSLYKPRERVHCCAGDPEKIIYSPFYDDQGRLELESTGVINLYDEIQSHADSVDIHVLLARYANGDPDALNKVQGVFGDFTEMPHTYAELLNNVIHGENAFMALPVEIRAKFNHSFTEFMAGVGTPEWNEKLSVSEKKAVEAVSEQEVMTDEP